MKPRIGGFVWDLEYDADLRLHLRIRPDHGWHFYLSDQKRVDDERWEEIEGIEMNAESALALGRVLVEMGERAREAKAKG